MFLLVAPQLGFKIEPTALTGYGAITTYVLTQRNQWTKDPPKPPAADVKAGDDT